MFNLDRDTLFNGLTRPLLLLGVPYGYAVVNGVLVTELFLIFKSPWVFLVGLVLHLVGWSVTVVDPYRFEQWLLKVRFCPRIPNFSAWGCNSYRP